jgi:hypothetical protein
MKNPTVAPEALPSWGGQLVVLFGRLLFAMAYTVVAIYVDTYSLIARLALAAASVLLSVLPSTYLVVTSGVSLLYPNASSAAGTILGAGGQLTIVVQMALILKSAVLDGEVQSGALVGVFVSFLLFNYQVLNVYIPLALFGGLIVTQTMGYGPEVQIALLQTGYAEFNGILRYGVDFLQRNIVDPIDTTLRTLVPPINRLLLRLNLEGKAFLEALLSAVIRMANIALAFVEGTGFACVGVSPVCVDVSLGVTPPAGGVQCVPFELRCVVTDIYNAFANTVERMVAALINPTVASSMRNGADALLEVYFAYIELQYYSQPGSPARLQAAVLGIITIMSEIPTLILSFLLQVKIIATVINALKMILPLIATTYNDAARFFNDTIGTVLVAIMDIVFAPWVSLCRELGDAFIIGDLIGAMTICTRLSYMQIEDPMLPYISFPAILTRRLLMHAPPPPINYALQKNLTLDRLLVVARASMHPQHQCVNVLADIHAHTKTLEGNQTILACTAKVMGHATLARLQELSASPNATARVEHRLAPALSIYHGAGPRLQGVVRQVLTQEPTRASFGSSSCYVAVAAPMVHLQGASAASATAHYSYCVTAAAARAAASDHIAYAASWILPSDVHARIFAEDPGGSGSAAGGDADPVAGGGEEGSVFHDVVSVAVAAATCGADGDNAEQICEGSREEKSHRARADRQTAYSSSNASPPPKSSAKYCTTLEQGATKKELAYCRLYGFHARGALFMHLPGTPAFDDAALVYHGAATKITRADNATPADAVAPPPARSVPMRIPQNHRVGRGLQQAPPIPQSGETIVFPGLDRKIDDFLLRTFGDAVNLVQIALARSFRLFLLYVITFDTNVDGIGRALYQLVLFCPYEETAAARDLQWTPICLPLKWQLPPRFSLPLVVSDRVEAFDSQCSTNTYTAQSPFFPWLQHTVGDPAVPLLAHCDVPLQTCRVELTDGFFVMANAIDQRMRSSSEFIAYLQPGVPEARLHDLRGGGFSIPGNIPYPTISFLLTTARREELPRAIQFLGYLPIITTARTENALNITIMGAFPAVDRFLSLYDPSNPGGRNGDDVWVGCEIAMLHSVLRAILTMSVYVAIRIAYYLVGLMTAIAIGGQLGGLLVFPSLTIGGMVQIGDAIIALHIAHKQRQSAVRAARNVDYAIDRIARLEAREEALEEATTRRRAIGSTEPSESGEKKGGPLSSTAANPAFVNDPMGVAVVELAAPPLVAVAASMAVAVTARSSPPPGLRVNANGSGGKNYRWIPAPAQPYIPTGAGEWWPSSQENRMYLRQHNE